MAKNIYVGIANKARKLKNIYLGIASKARKTKGAYNGISERARSCFAGGDPGYSISAQSGVNLSFADDVGSNILGLTNSYSYKINPSTMTYTSGSYSTTYTGAKGPVCNKFVGSFCGGYSDWNSSGTKIIYSYNSSGKIINDSLTATSISVYKAFDVATATNRTLGFFIGGYTYTYQSSTEWEKENPLSTGYSVNSSGSRSSVTVSSTLSGCSTGSGIDGSSYAVFADGCVAYRHSSGNSAVSGINPKHCVYAYNTSGSSTSCVKPTDSDGERFFRICRESHADLYFIVYRDDYKFYNTSSLSATTLNSLGDVYTGPSTYSLCKSGSTLYKLNSSLIKSLIGNTTNKSIVTNGIRVPGYSSFIFANSGGKFSRLAV